MKQIKEIINIHRHHCPTLLQVLGKENRYGNWFCIELAKIYVHRLNREFFVITLVQ